MWRIIVDEKRWPDEHHALDEAIFEAVAAGRSDPTIRLFRPIRTYISIGCREDEASIVKPGYSHGMQVIRRLDAGYTVMHSPADPCYSVIVPVDQYDRDSVLELISESIVPALAKAGISVWRPKKHSFVVGEMPNVRKVVGHGQRQIGNVSITSGVVFYHGPEGLSNRLLISKEQEKRMVGIKTLSSATEGDIWNYLTKGFQTRLSGQCYVSCATAEELARMKELETTYAPDSEWSRKGIGLHPGQACGTCISALDDSKKMPSP